MGVRERKKERGVLAHAGAVSQRQAVRVQAGVYGVEGGGRVNGCVDRSDKQVAYKQVGRDKCVREKECVRTRVSSGGGGQVDRSDIQFANKQVGGWEGLAAVFFVFGEGAKGTTPASSLLQANERARVCVCVCARAHTTTHRCHHHPYPPGLNLITPHPNSSHP